jgi:hypothetical protein
MVILLKLYKLLRWTLALSVPILLLSSSSVEQWTAGSGIQVELKGPTPFQNRESVSQYADILISNSLPINMRVLEESLSVLNGVNRAEVFSDGKGGLYAEIWQSQPLVRLFELDTSYYLDTDGYPIALSPLWSESVPLLRCKEGHKPHPDIHELFLFIQEDGLLSEAVDAVELVENDELILYASRACAHSVRLGTWDGWKERLEKLRTFYSEVVDAGKRTLFNELDLRFEGQVVVKK